LQGFIPRLIELVSPVYSPDVHGIASELIKGIISIAAPSPGAGLADGLSNGPASNRFARELAQASNVEKLAGYILSNFPKSAESSTQPPPSATLPSIESTTSSILQSISVFVELIRKNNSDYYEPYLFHTLRNRLIQVQQHLQGQDARETLEQAMNDMVNRIGIVHLGPILEVMCDNLEILQSYLKAPRSLVGSFFPLLSVDFSSGK
jgi:serine/threonine-protein phosphatase 6 regulatory subunit 3